MVGGGAVPTHNVIGGREFPFVSWTKRPNLRKLYGLLSTVILVSATNGFDGSMMNGLQAVDKWKECMLTIFEICGDLHSDSRPQTSIPPLPSSVFLTLSCLLVPSAPSQSRPSLRTGEDVGSLFLSVSPSCSSVLLSSLPLPISPCSLVPVSS